MVLYLLLSLISPSSSRWYDSATCLFEQAHQLICQARRLSPPLAHLLSSQVGHEELKADCAIDLGVCLGNRWARSILLLLPQLLPQLISSSFLTQRRRFMEDTAEARRRAHGWYLQALETRRRLLPAGHPQIERAKAGCDAHAADAEEMNESQA